MQRVLSVSLLVRRCEIHGNVQMHFAASKYVIEEAVPFHEAQFRESDLSVLEIPLSHGLDTGKELLHDPVPSSRSFAEEFDFEFFSFV